MPSLGNGQRLEGPEGCDGDVPSIEGDAPSLDSSETLANEGELAES